MHRLSRATVNSWNGFLAAARSEAAFREELIVLAVALPLSLLIAVNPWRWLMLILVLLLLLVVELLNTAIEKLSDHVTMETHPAIGRIKDMGSAAVFVSIVIAGLTWLFALTERLGLW